MRRGRTISSPQCSIRRHAAPDSAGCAPRRPGGAGRDWKSRSARRHQFYRDTFPSRKAERRMKLSRRGDPLVAANHDQQAGTTGDARRIVPVRQFAHRIGADEEEPFGAWIALPQFFKRIHGVTGPGALVLALIDAKGRMAGGGQLEHFDPVPKRGDGGSAACAAAARTGRTAPDRAAPARGTAPPGSDDRGAPDQRSRRRRRCAWWLLAELVCHVATSASRLSARKRGRLRLRGRGGSIPSRCCRLAYRKSVATGGPRPNGRLR